MPLFSALPAAAALSGTDELLIDQAGSFGRATVAQIVAEVLAAANQVPPGALVPFAGATAPAGYLLCNGAAVGRGAQAALFAAIGTAWGVGDGSTTFNLPDLRGRVLLGVGTGAGLSTYTLAAAGGEEAHQLTELELAAHTHDFTMLLDDTIGLEYPESVSGADNSPELTTYTTAAAGGDQPHENRQPYAAVNWLIKT